MKNRILAFANWAQTNWLALVIFMTVILMILLCVIAFSWIFGYWSNGLYGTKFELGSCWSGITVVITGFGGVIGLAKAAWTKYATDSEKNSPIGEMPINFKNNINKERNGLNG
ncbi:MAG: hypothetical protein H6Q70_532 [Firmicutes bacterium]|nr:hypothetical protein [Bacillota bacterium]